MLRHNSPHARISLVGLLLIVNLFVTPLIALSSPPKAPASLSPNSPPTPAYEISPSSGVLGKDYEVVVTRTDCSTGPPVTNKIGDLKLYAPEGSGIIVNNTGQTDCSLSAKLSIARDATITEGKLWLVNKDAKPPLTPVATVDFAVTTIPQGPTPTGKGVVDIMWSVLPDKIVKDNFGGKVARQFYCIEAVIGNDSGYDLQLSSIGFTLPGAISSNRIPTTGYRTVRGSLEAWGEVSPRRFVMSAFNVLGPLLTGFIPFFHVTAHKANFTEFINIISNPIEKGVESAWPDVLTAELDRLADSTFRDDVSTKTVIPNNVQSRIVTFVPKRLVFPNKPDGKPAPEEDPKNPQAVMKKLGELVIVGKEVTYINRIRVVSSGLEREPSDTSITGRIVDPCDAGVGGVTVTLSAQDFASRDVTTTKDGNFTIPNVPLGRTYTITPKLENLEFMPESKRFNVNDSERNVNFRADYTVLVITGKIVEKSAPAKKMSVTLTPAGLVEKPVETNDAGVYRFEIPGTKVKLSGATTYEITPQSKKHTFKPEKGSWTCGEKKLDFEAIPIPSPTPSPSQ